MLTFQEFITEKFSQRDFINLEEVLDQIFKKLNIDIEFTQHFKDRLNDTRNGKEITQAEIISTFNKTYQKYGQQFKTLSHDYQAVINDINNDLNIPFIIKHRNGYFELLAKTIMRKPNFQTRNTKYIIK